jgi:hypothetical protein
MWGVSSTVNHAVEGKLLVATAAVRDCPFGLGALQVLFLFSDFLLLLCFSGFALLGLRCTDGTGCIECRYSINLCLMDRAVTQSLLGIGVGAPDIGFEPDRAGVRTPGGLVKNKICRVKLEVVRLESVFDIVNVSLVKSSFKECFPVYMLD